MSLKHGLLGLLNYGSMTGYELNKAFKDSLFSFWQAKASQIYRELDAMEGYGWLTSRRIIQSEKPNKRLYTITNRGKEALMDWLSAPEADIADAMRVKSAFLMRVFFAGETSKAQALDLLHAYREACLANCREMQAGHDAIATYETVVKDEKKSAYWKITLLYGEAFSQAGLQWVDQAIAILKEMES